MTAEKTAILGAGRIGKHHSKWWLECGNEVCAILTSSPESAKRRASELKGFCGFQGRAYHSLETLLKNETPEIVDICTPPELHYEHALASLNANCHVLCEKPLLFRENTQINDLLGKAHELETLAELKNLRFSLCSQFYAVGKTALKLFKTNKDEQISEFRSILATPARGRSRNPKDCWLDLGPHLIASMQAAFPAAMIDWTSLNISSEAHRTDVLLDLLLPNGRTTHCRLTSDRTESGPTHIKQLSFNDFTIDLEGRDGKDGRYKTVFMLPEKKELITEDIMYRTIKAFAKEKPMMSPKATLENMQNTLKIYAS